MLATLATSRWSARAVAVAAGATATAGTGLIAAAPNVPVLAAGVIIAGSSTGLASPPLADAVARWVAADQADRVQTVINAGTGLGVMVSGPVALLTAQTWRLAWWAFALVAACVTLWSAAAIPRRGRAADATRGASPQSQPHPRPHPQAGPRRAALWPPGAARLLAAAGVLGIASSAVWTFGRDLVVTVGGASPLASTLMWIILGAAGLAGAFTGSLIGHVGLTPTWITGMLALAAATASLAAATTSYLVIFTAAAVFGAVYIALTGLLLVWGTRVYPDRPAFGVGSAFLLIALGQTVGAPLVGLLTDLTTATGAFLTAAAAAAAGAALHPTHT